MKLLIALILGLGAVYFYPQINEDTGSPCGALEKRFVRDAFRGSGQADLFGALLASGTTNGALAASLVKSAHPNVPAVFGCLRSYYGLMMDPESARAMVDRYAK